MDVAGCGHHGKECRDNAERELPQVWMLPPEMMQHLRHIVQKRITTRVLGDGSSEKDGYT